MTQTLATELVFAVDGSLDEAGSIRRFENALAEFQASRLLESDTILTAVHAVFDQYRGEAIPMPALTSAVLQALHVLPSNYKTMEEKVTNCIRENADQSEKKDRKTGEVTRQAELPRTRTFGIRKGVGGGVCRWTDVPVK